jgi:hypothetical protein
LGEPENLFVVRGVLSAGQVGEGAAQPDPHSFLPQVSTVDKRSSRRWGVLTERVFDKGVFSLVIPLRVSSPHLSLFREGCVVFG